jgi:hypothetical protein
MITYLCSDKTSMSKGCTIDETFVEMTCPYPLIRKDNLDFIQEWRQQWRQEYEIYKHLFDNRFRSNELPDILVPDLWAIVFDFFVHTTQICMSIPNKYFIQDRTYSGNLFRVWQEKVSSKLIVWIVIGIETSDQVEYKAVKDLDMDPTGIPTIPEHCRVVIQLDLYSQYFCDIELTRVFNRLFIECTSITTLPTFQICYLMSLPDDFRPSRDNLTIINGSIDESIDVFGYLLAHPGGCLSCSFKSKCTRMEKFVFNVIL